MSKVIYKLGNNITADDICPNVCRTGSGNPTPRDCAFGMIYQLRTELNKYNLNEAITIVCGNNFGIGGHTPDAEESLLSYNLTIIANSIDKPFFNACTPALQNHLIQCPTLNVGNVDVDDEIEIQTNKLIQKRHFDTTPVKSSESSEGDEEAPEE